MREPTENIKVKHDVWGVGMVIDQRHSGHEFLIRFPNKLLLWLKRNSLSFLDDPESALHSGEASITGPLPASSQGNPGKMYAPTATERNPASPGINPVTSRSRDISLSLKPVQADCPIESEGAHITLVPEGDKNLPESTQVNDLPASNSQACDAKDPEGRILGNRAPENKADENRYSRDNKSPPGSSSKGRGFERQKPALSFALSENRTDGPSENNHAACPVETKYAQGLRPRIVPIFSTSNEERAVIEAFRLGIVPIRAIKEWTVGRTGELEKVSKWLQDESSGSMIIRGEYGSGKSHLIEYLHSSGLELNYAVSMVAIDPCDAQPGFPKRVYRHFIKNLRFPYENQYLDFNEAFTLIGKGAKENPLSDHRFLGKIFQNIIKNRDIPQMWEWIEGQETAYSNLGILYDHTTAANIYCNILSAIGSLAVNVLGLKGVLLMFDEAETSRTYRYNYEWTRALNFFNALSMVANDEHDLMDERVVRGKYYYYGDKTGLIYSGILPIPYIYKLPSYLKVAFAFTPDCNLNFYQDHNIWEIELDTLPIEHMEHLFYRLADLYEKVYRTCLPSDHKRYLFGQVIQGDSYSTRRFIKAMVECLDFCRFYPSENPRILFSNGLSNRAF